MNETFISLSSHAVIDDNLDGSAVGSSVLH